MKKCTASFQPTWKDVPGDVKKNIQYNMFELVLA